MVIELAGIIDPTERSRCPAIISSPTGSAMMPSSEATLSQLAARLATALRSWRSLEPGRQAKAREALLTIAGTEKLSADLRDIAERTLA